MRTFLDRGQILINCLIRSVDKRAIQRQLLFVETSPVEGPIRAIDEYLAIGSVDRPVCKDVGDDTTASQLTKLELTLIEQQEVSSAQSAMSTAQSDAIHKLLHMLETLQH